jgi:hypothetical protein
MNNESGGDPVKDALLSLLHEEGGFVSFDRLANRLLRVKKNVKITEFKLKTLIHEMVQCGSISVSSIDETQEKVNNLRSNHSTANPCPKCDKKKFVPFYMKSGDIRRRIGYFCCNCKFISIFIQAS